MDVFWTPGDCQAPQTNREDNLVGLFAFMLVCLHAGRELLFPAFGWDACPLIFHLLSNILLLALLEEFWVLVVDSQALFQGSVLISTLERHEKACFLAAVVESINFVVTALLSFLPH